MADTINREAALDALYHVDEYNRRSIEAIRNLPSAEKVGKWIDEGENSAPICSECKSRALLNYESDYHKSDYCPHCGARMEGSDNE